jgi:hypothetical protein
VLSRRKHDHYSPRASPINSKQRALYEMVPRRQSDFARALTVGPATLNADQCAMARPCGLSPSRSSGIRIHAKAVNAADTRMSGASRLLNTC